MKFRTPLYPAAAVVVIFTLAAVVLLPASTALAGRRPEPSVFPLPDHWYLDFKHGVPKRIVVDAPGQKGPTAYWYLTYTVTNNTKDDQDFVPEFEMVTQDGRIHRSDMQETVTPDGKVHPHGMLPAVFQAIKKKESNTLLLPRNRVIGTLHQGEDQAKDGVAIWEEPLPRMGAFSIYVAGLNNEFVVATDEKGDAIPDPDGHKTADGTDAGITLRKTLEMDYVIWGDEVEPNKDDVQTKKERWIMR